MKRKVLSYCLGLGSKNKGNYQPTFFFTFHVDVYSFPPKQFWFWQPKNQLLTKKSGLRAAPTLWWSVTKNCLHQGLGKGYCDQLNFVYHCDHIFKKKRKKEKRAHVEPNLVNLSEEYKWRKNRASYGHNDAVNHCACRVLRHIQTYTVV